MDAVSQPHDLHDLLETTLLLIHDALDQHGHGVDPREHHEQWQTAGDGHGEPGANHGVQ